MYAKFVTACFLVLACLYCCVSGSLSHKRHEHGLKHVEPDDDDFVEDVVKKSNINVKNSTDAAGKSADEDGEKKDVVSHIPAELNWDWGTFNVKSNPLAERKERKTIIPLEGIVFAKVKDNHVIKPKLSTRYFSEKRAQKPRITSSRHTKLSTLSRRFDLYPRWFSNSIPNLFGKHFARRYYKPFGSIESANGQTRHHILRRRRKPRAHTMVHELPESWMASEGRDDSRNEIPKKTEIEGEEGKPLDDESATDDNLVLDPQNAEGREHGSDPADKKSMPFLKDIQHEVLSELNPYEYTSLLPGRGEARPHVAHRHAHVATHTAHVIGHVPAAEHVVADVGEAADVVPSALDNTHQTWTAFNSLPAHHHHRHKLNPCFHNPCLNRGHCHFNGGNFKCQCRPGFSGDICDHTRFSCHPNPCYNGGTCTVLQTGYFCSCLPGFRGGECEGQNPCASNPCANQGKCTDTADGFYCTCGHGFSGKTCGDDVHAEELNVDNVNENALAQATGIRDHALAAHVATEQHEIEKEMEGMVLHDKIHDMEPATPVAPVTAGLHETGLHDTGLHEAGLQTGLHAGLPDAVTGLHAGLPDAVTGLHAGLPDAGLPVSGVHDTALFNGVGTLHDGASVHAVGEHAVEAGTVAGGDHVFGGAPTLHELGAPSGPTRVEDLSLGETSVECPINACLNGGTCIKTATSTICNCPHGHHGTRCESITIPEGTARAVGIGSSQEVSGVVHGLGLHEVGALHEVSAAQELTANDVHPTHTANFDEVCPLTCQNGGVCMKDAAKGFACNCPSEFHGDLCEDHAGLLGGLTKVTAIGSAVPAALAAENANPLMDVHNPTKVISVECITPCRNGGSCIKTITGPTCSCPAGFSGAACEARAALAAMKAIAQSTIGQSMMGLLGMPGPKLVEVEFNCRITACKNGGSCMPGIGPRQVCNCPVGFHGFDCGSVGPIDHLGDMHETTNALVPQMGFNCGPDTCKNGGSCLKAASGGITGHICTCAVGFHGADCGSPDLCTPNPCENGGSCIQEGDENYKCTCLPGYKGLDCNLANHCTKDPCKNNGVCEETPDSFRCTCATGFKGRDCTAISPCQLNPCLHKGTCIEKGTNYVCQCHPGFKGATCHIKDPCFPNPCMNGLCAEDMGIAMCNCSHGWMGHRCDANDWCANAPCLNGGSCEHGENNFKCLCPPSFHGPNCEVQDPCHSNPCENNGRCDHAGSAFVCSCPSGFHGERCHLKAHCQPSPCNAHGECFESDEGFICECNPRYMGKFCEIMRFCVDQPCVNGGHCAEGDNTFHCECPFGYKGKTCAVNVCDSHPCLNGGTCIPAENEDGYGCECVFPYHGVTCGEMDPCLTNPCRNGGICQSQLQSLHDASFGHHGGLSVFGPYDCLNGGMGNGGSRFTNNGCYSDNEKDQRPMFGDDIEKDHRTEGKGIEGKGIEGKGIAPYASDYGKDSYQDKDRYGAYDAAKDTEKDSGAYDPTKDTEKDGAFDAGKDGHMDRDKDGSFDTGKDGSMDKDKDGAFDKGKDGHLDSTKDFRPKDEEDGSRDAGKDAHSGSDQPKDNGHLDNEKDTKTFGDNPKDNWPIEAKNDHPGLLDKVDYYPKHQPEPEANEPAPEPKLPPCPCNPQPCAWPPTCQPQACTPPCRRHYDDHHHHFEEPGDYKKSNIKTPQNITQAAKRHKVVKRDTNRRLFESRYLGKWNSPKADSIQLVKRGTQHERNDMTQLSIKEILALKRDQILNVQASKRLEIIPKVIINFRHPGETSVYRRTMHELYVCQCMPGYLGAHCQHMNPCRETPCTNGGTCIPRGDHYVCQCLAGYGGRHCDDPHPCSPNPCTHNGKCHLAKSVRGYECRCKSGWRGFNCEDRDNCALGNPCKHDGSCINVDGAEGGIECKCRTRYSGKHCEIDACAACDINAYCHHGNCVCESGYFGNGFRCKAMTDICTPNPCDNKGECRPGVDGKLFSCECQPGYVGTRCELPHPCANNPCLHNGACVDESNSKDRGILLLDRNDYKCFCSAGFKGKNCGETSLAACSSGPCQNNGTCFDASSESHSKHLTRSEDYECFCDMGYTGKNCQINHFACYSYPCVNGGTCLDAETLPDINFDAHGYKCNCNHGFTGRNCEVTVYGPGPCHQSPCLNNGRCLDAMNSNDPDIHFDYEHQFKCICPPTYSGRICEIPYPACFSRPCHNKGICNDRTKDPNGVFDETGYTCTCMAGYDGKNCERQNSLAILEEPDSSNSHDYATEAKNEGKSDDDTPPTEAKVEGKKDDDAADAQQGKQTDEKNVNDDADDTNIQHLMIDHDSPRSDDDVIRVIPAKTPTDIAVPKPVPLTNTSTTPDKETSPDSQPTKFQDNAMEPTVDSDEANPQVELKVHKAVPEVAHVIPEATHIVPDVSRLIPTNPSPTVMMHSREPEVYSAPHIWHLNDGSEKSNVRSLNDGGPKVLNTHKELDHHETSGSLLSTAFSKKHLHQTTNHLEPTKHHVEPPKHKPKTEKYKSKIISKQYKLLSTKPMSHHSSKHEVVYPMNIVDQQRFAVHFSVKNITGSKKSSAVSKTPSHSKSTSSAQRKSSTKVVYPLPKPSLSGTAHNRNKVQTNNKQGHHASLHLANDSLGHNPVVNKAHVHPHAKKKVAPVKSDAALYNLTTYLSSKYSIPNDMYDDIDDAADFFNIKSLEDSLSESFDKKSSKAVPYNPKPLPEGKSIKPDTKGNIQARYVAGHSNDRTKFITAGINIPNLLDTKNMKTLGAPSRYLPPLHLPQLSRFIPLMKNSSLGTKVKAQARFIAPNPADKKKIVTGGTQPLGMSRYKSSAAAMTPDQKKYMSSRALYMKLRMNEFRMRQKIARAIRVKNAMRLHHMKPIYRMLLSKHIKDKSKIKGFENAYSFLNEKTGAQNNNIWETLYKTFKKIGDDKLAKKRVSGPSIMQTGG